MQHPVTPSVIVELIIAASNITPIDDDESADCGGNNGAGRSTGTKDHIYSFENLNLHKHPLTKSWSHSCSSANKHIPKKSCCLCEYDVDSLSPHHAARLNLGEILAKRARGHCNVTKTRQISQRGVFNTESDIICHFLIFLRTAFLVFSYFQNSLRQKKYSQLSAMA